MDAPGYGPRNLADLFVGWFMAICSPEEGVAERVWSVRYPEWYQIMIGENIALSEAKDPNTLTVDKFLQGKLDKYVSGWLGAGCAPLDNLGWEEGFKTVNDFFRSDFGREVAFYTDEARIPEKGRIGLILRTCVRYLDWCEKNGHGHKLNNPQAISIRALRDALRRERAKIKHVRHTPRGGGDLEM
jgi:hypothetical protein